MIDTILYYCLFFGVHYSVLQSHINLSEVALSVRDYQASQRHLDKAAKSSGKVH
jgi:hypothetical protein